MWRRTSQRIGFSPPIVAGEYVFSGGHVLDVADGSIYWQTDIEIPATGQDEIGGFQPPAPGLSGEHLLIPDTYDMQLRALSATGGTTRWTVGVDLSTATSPIVSHGTVFTGGYRLSAHDLADGTLDWEVETDQDIEVPVAVADDIVVGTTYLGRVVAVNRTSGDIEWEGNVPNQPQGPPLIDDERVYVTSSHLVRAFDRADGTEQWTVDFSFPNIARAESLLVVGGGGGLLALDPETGDRELEQWFDAVGVGIPTVAGDVTYVSTRDPEALIAYDLADNTERWRYDLETIVGPVTPVDDSLYIRLDDTELVRLA